MTSQRMRSLDELFRVHQRYLGPDGWTLPFSIPYVSILPGVAVAGVALIALSLIGLGAWRFLIAAACGIAAGALVSRYAGGERPVSALPAVFTHETTAPRPSAPQAHHAVLRPGQVAVRDMPPVSRRKRVRK